MIIDRTTLSTALTAAARVASSRATLAVLANVKLTAAQNRLTLETTDLERSLSQEIPAQSEADLWQTTVDAKKLAEIVAVMDGADVELTNKISGAGRTWLTVKSGGAVVELPGIPASEFPPFPVMPEGVTVDAAAFCDAVSRVVCAASTEEARPVLCGVNFDGKVMVATDSFRIHVMPFELPARAIVPAKSLTEAVKLFGKCKNVTVSVTNGQWFISDGAVTLVSQTIEGAYPDFNAIIPKGDPISTATFEVARLVASVRRVSLMATNNVIKFSQGDETMHLSAEGDNGKIEDEVDIPHGYPMQAFALNGRFVLDALVCARRNPVKIAVNHPNTPVLVEDGSGWMAVIMPMHVEGK